MIVKFEFEHDVETVYNTITNPEFLKQRALNLGSVEAQSDAVQEDTGNKVTLIRKRKIKVPAVLKSMLKTIQTAHTDELWNNSGENYSCQNSTRVDGAPLNISGQISLNPSATGCSFQAEFEPEAKVRFFRKKLQKYAAKTIAKEIELECEYTAKHLASIS